MDNSASPNIYNSIDEIIKEHNNNKIILDNELIKITLMSDIQIHDVQCNVLYATLKSNFMETIKDFESINGYTQEFLRALDNIYNAFSIANNKLSIIYDVTKVTSLFPPTLLWNIGNFFSKKKKNY